MSDLEAIGRLILALTLGAVIGMEREHERRPAGLRTFSLVALGSCLYMLVSVLTGFGSSGQPGDAGRIAAQVVTGIGFLGGGMLVRSGATVHGLTTAAGIWVAAALGLAVGAGHYSIAIATTVLTLIVLHLFHWLEKHPSAAPSERPAEEVLPSREGGEFQLPGLGASPDEHRN